MGDELLPYKMPFIFAALQIGNIPLIFLFVVVVFFLFFFFLSLLEYFMLGQREGGGKGRGKRLAELPTLRPSLAYLYEFDPTENVAYGYARLPTSIIP